MVTHACPGCPLIFLQYALRQRHFKLDSCLRCRPCNIVFTTAAKARTHAMQCDRPQVAVLLRHYNAKSRLRKCALAKWKRFDAAKNKPQLDAENFSGFSEVDLEGLANPYDALLDILEMKADGVVSSSSSRSDLSKPRLKRKRPKFWFEKKEADAVRSAKRMKQADGGKEKRGTPIPTEEVMEDIDLYLWVRLEYTVIKVSV